MRPLTDLEVLALLIAQPVDGDATSDLGGDDKIAPGHAAPWEHRYARTIFGEAMGEFPRKIHPQYAKEARDKLARIFGLSERADDCPIEVSLSWQAERRSMRDKIYDALARVTASTDKRSVDQVVSDLVDEVVRLRDSTSKEIV